MTRKISPMYCGLFAISGFHTEKELAQAVLAAAGLKVPSMVVMPVGERDFVYAQCTFLVEDHHEAPFKFVDRIATLATNGVFPTLVANCGLAQVLFVHRSLFDAFKTHRAFGKFAHLFKHLELPGVGNVGAVGEEPAGPSLLVRAASRIAPSLFPEPRAGEKMDIGEGRKKFHAALLQKVEESSDLGDLLFAMFSLCKGFSEDLLVDALNRRVARTDCDPVGRVLRGILAASRLAWTEACEDLRIAAELDPSRWQALLWLGMAEWGRGNSDAARDALARATGPELAKNGTLAAAVLALRGAVEDQRGDLEAATAAFEQAIRTNPRHFGFHILLGDLLFRAGQLDRAIDELDQALLLEPQSLWGRALYCEALWQSGDLAACREAAKDWKEAFSGGSEAAAFLDTGTSKAGLDRYRELGAFRRRHQVLLSGPDWTDLIEDGAAKTFVSAFLQDHRTENDLPVKWARWRVMFREKFADAVWWAALGYVTYAQSRWQEATAHFESAVALNPSKADYHQFLTKALRRCSKHQEAMAALLRSRSFGLVWPKMQLLEAELLLHLGRQPEACEVLRDLLRTRGPETGSDWTHIADEFRNAGLLEEALLAVRKSDEIEPNVGTTIIDVGRHLWLLGRREEALASLDKGLALSPADQQGLAWRVRILCELGRSGEASEALSHLAKTWVDDLDDIYALKDLMTSAGLQSAWTDAFTEIVSSGADGFTWLLAKLKSHVQGGQFREAVSLADLYLQSMGATDIGGLVLAQKGKALFGLGELDAACHCLEEARRRLPTLGDIVGDHAAVLHTAGRLEDSAAAREEQLRLDPENPEALSDLGFMKYRLKRYAEAVSDLRKSIALAPDVAWTHGILGVVLVAQGEKEAAISELRKAIEFNPDLHWPVGDLCELLSGMQRYEEAMAVCDRALAANPRHRNAIASRADVLFACSRDAEAIAFLAECSGICADDAELLGSIGRALRRNYRPTEALATCRDGLARFPDETDLWMVHAGALIDLGRFADARPCIDRVLQLKPDEPFALELSALLVFYMASQGGPVDIEVGRRCVAVSPDSAYSHERYADLLWLSGDLDAAAEAHGTALRLHQSATEDTNLQQGWCLLQLGRPQEAIDKYEVYIRTQPKEPAPKLDFALACIASGDVHKGLGAYSRAIAGPWSVPAEYVKGAMVQHLTGLRPWQARHLHGDLKHAAAEAIRHLDSVIASA